MTTYAKVLNGEILKIGPRPEWYVDGQLVGDDVLKSGGFEVDANNTPLEDSKGNYVLATGRSGWIPIVQQDMTPFDSTFYDFSWDDESEWVVEDSRVVKTHTITERPLDQIKSLASESVNKMADTCRASFITIGNIGVALEYIETKNEVEHWLSSESPELSNYPMINAEFKALSIASPELLPGEVVAEMMYEINLWNIGSSAIKEVRRSGLVGIDISLDKDDIDDILQWCQTAFTEISTNGNFTTEFPAISL